MSHVFTPTARREGGRPRSTRERWPDSTQVHPNRWASSCPCDLTPQGTSVTCRKQPLSPPTLGGFPQNVPGSQTPSLDGLFCGDHAPPLPAGHSPPSLQLLRGRTKPSTPALPRTAQTHSLHIPWRREARPLGCSFGTWMEEACLQGSLEGQEQLLPLVSSLQAVLEVLDGWPGVREVCRSAPGLAYTCEHARTVHASEDASGQGPEAEQPDLRSATLRDTCWGSRSPLHPPKPTTPHGAEGQRRDMKLEGGAWTPRSTVRCPVTPALTLSWGSPR